MKKIIVFLGDERFDFESLIVASRVATDALLNGLPEEDLLVLKLRGVGECGEDTYDKVELAEVFSASRHPAGR